MNSLLSEDDSLNYFNRINFGEMNFSRDLQILPFFAKVCLAKNLKLVIRETLSREILRPFQFAKVYPLKLQLFSPIFLHILDF